MLLFEVGDNASFGKFATRHCRIKTGVPGIIDAAYGVGFHTVSLEGVTQPLAWSRWP